MCVTYLTDPQRATKSDVLLYTLIAFGFVAALLEDIPIIGLAFTVSNRIGAAMWAHGMFLYLCYFERAGCFGRIPLPFQEANAGHLDLEKRQHYVAELKRSGHREKENEGERLKNN
jgi:hypothetical protein